MPATRLLVAVLALALAPAGLVAAAPTATAAQPSASVGQAQRAAAEQRVPITAKIVKRKGKLTLTGVVRPRRGPVVVQRATDCNRKTGVCNFKKYRTTKVDDKGRYTQRVRAPRTGAWAWRATRAKDTSEVWLTCVKKPEDDCPIP